MKSTTGTPVSEKICPSVLKTVLRGSVGGRTSPRTSRCFAGGMNEPDIAAQLAGPAHFEKDRRSQHQGGRCGVIVISSRGGETSTFRPIHRLIAIRHEGRVVVVAHDDRA